MPNHETNTVVITGPVEKVLEFINEGTVSGEGSEPAWGASEAPARLISFNRIVPQPENIQTGGCPGGTVDGVHPETGEICWYVWNLANWGTKWEAYDHRHFEHRVLAENGGVPYGRVDLVFCTAWSQPAPVFKAIEERWGLTVVAVTQDEGGFPDTEYGSPLETGYIVREVSYNFDSWDAEIDVLSIPKTAEHAPEDAPTQTALGRG